MTRGTVLGGTRPELLLFTFLWKLQGADSVSQALQISPLLHKVVSWGLRQTLHEWQSIYLLRDKWR